MKKEIVPREETLENAKGSSRLSGDDTAIQPWAYSSADFI
jgi:hypothetical protein